MRGEAQMKKLKLLHVKTGKAPETIEVNGSLRVLQGLVGGYIETVRIGKEYVLVVNDMGKLQGLPLNFIWTKNGKVLDEIHGDAFIACAGEEDFESLTETQIEKLKGAFGTFEEWYKAFDAAMI
jgi:hypothetical protein